ncbi:MAG: transcriptional regulator [Rhodobacterales bacterium 65-51]|uniref:MocR-like pyridoxine biosynthesis transcription factor PdxR n=1 Tax=uncultured Gemmobacter sp. TaxID=1095917 RepID=UPI000963C948|nr:PLP-dependent aminotransferase family protein [uncultured Gemmobacter sp.]OJY26864.1 MAG: transcriptional regulator [Rhodobacterales bacterium 65-51]
MQTNRPDWSALMPILPEQGPRARAIYAALRQRIEEGALPSGTKLPPTRDLAARLGVARGAVVAAFEMLAAEGFTEAKVGSGTFVAEAVPCLVPAGPAPVPPVFVARDLPGDLGLGFPDPQSLDRLRAILARVLARPPAALFHYGDPQGDATLRAEVAAYLRAARGVRLDPAQVVITTGAQGALDLVARAVLAPGDPVWMENPGYPSAKAAFAAQRLVPVPVDDEGLDVAAGRVLCAGARAAYVTPSHQFPLGVVLTMRRRLALLDWAAEAGAWVVEDDYDSEFRFAGPPLAAMQGMDGRGRVIYVGTFSKALMPGLRLGYMVLPEPLLAPVIALRGRADRAPSALTQAAMAEFLAAGHFAQHLKRARRRVRAARDALVSELAAAGHRVRIPEQGLHLVVALSDTADDLRLAGLARAAGLGARSLSAMSMQPDGRKGLVIGFSGHEPETLAAAVRRGLAAAGLT